MYPKVINLFMKAKSARTGINATPEVGVIYGYHNIVCGFLLSRSKNTE